MNRRLAILFSVAALLAISQSGCVLIRHGETPLLPPPCIPVLLARLDSASDQSSSYELLILARGIQRRFTAFLQEDGRSRALALFGPLGNKELVVRSEDRQISVTRGPRSELPLSGEDLFFSVVLASRAVDHPTLPNLTLSTTQCRFQSARDSDDSPSYTFFQGDQPVLRMERAVTARGDAVLLYFFARGTLMRITRAG